MKFSDNSKQILQLLNVRGIGPAKVQQVIDRSNQLDLSLRDFLKNAILARGVLSEKQIADFSDVGKGFEPMIQQVIECDADVISIADPEYPSKLKQRLGAKAPVLLFTKGKRDLLNSGGVGFCGSGSLMEKGLETAADCAEQLGQRQVNVFLVMRWVSIWQLIVRL